MNKSITLLLLLVSATTALPGTRPITHEDLWLMKRVGAPLVSPDGKWVVVSVTEPAYDESATAEDLWLVPTDGSAKAKRITHTRAPESGVQWSPDSLRVAFSTRREGDEVNQILRTRRSGWWRTATRVTSAFDRGLGSTMAPRWLGDRFHEHGLAPARTTTEANKKIAAERKAEKAHVRAYETFPIRYWDHWLDDRQIHLFVQELGEGSKARDLLAGHEVGEQPWILRHRDELGRGVGRSVVSGWAIARVRGRHPTAPSSAYARVITRLYQVPASGGEGQATHARRYRRELQ